MSASRFPVLRPRQLPDPPAWLAGRDSELGAFTQAARLYQGGGKQPSSAGGQ